MLSLADKIVSSRFLIGSALYPSLQIMRDAILASQSGVVTVSMKRQLVSARSTNAFWEVLRGMNLHILPNTAGCHRAAEAISLAEAAREIFSTHWIKLEVIGDDYNLQPDPFELVKAAATLVKSGFEVFPYCTDDLVLCQRLIDCGCKILMPWAAPIGSGKGVINPYALEVLRNRLPNATLIVDAGIGKPSQAALVMEMGYDGVLLNSAVALATDPVNMAVAFRYAIIAGQTAFAAGIMPLVDTPFWHQVQS